MKRLLGIAEDVFIAVLDRLIAVVDALTAKIAGRGGRASGGRTGQGKPRAAVRLTEGVVTCSKCDWSLVGPPRSLEIGYMLHAKREH